MKLLGNPWVVGLLGLGAVVVVVFNTFHPNGPHFPVPATGRATPVVSVNSPPPMPGGADNTPAAAPKVDIDLEYVRNHFSDWLMATQRDPFLQAKPLVAAVTNAPPRQMSQLKLRAIWRQDEVGMAAINGGIYRQGDAVDGRTIKRIEHNGVWLDFNGKREFLVFDGLPGAGGADSTNAPPTAPGKP